MGSSSTEKVARLAIVMVVTAIVLVIVVPTPTKALEAVTSWSMGSCSRQMRSARAVHPAARRGLRLVRAGIRYLVEDGDA